MENNITREDAIDFIFKHNMLTREKELLHTLLELERNRFRNVVDESLIEKFIKDFFDGKAKLSFDAKNKGFIFHLDDVEEFG